MQKLCKTIECDFLFHEFYHLYYINETGSPDQSPSLLEVKENTNSIIISTKIYFEN